MLTVFFLTWTSHAYTYTHTHTPSFEELISFFLLYPPLPPPIIRTVDGKEEAESPKRSQNGRGGTVGRAGWRRPSCTPPSGPEPAHHPGQGSGRASPACYAVPAQNWHLALTCSPLGQSPEIRHSPTSPPGPGIWPVPRGGIPL